MNFKFCTHILSVDRNKSPLQISGKVAGCVVRTLKTFQGSHILGALRGLLCGSSAVLSDTASCFTANDDVELKTRETGSTSARDQASTPYRPTEATATTHTEVQVHIQPERMSTYTGHYEEILDPESPPEQPTSEYAGLDPVAVAESRARPPPVYEGLGRR